jgi:hypothetical protein
MIYTNTYYKKSRERLDSSDSAQTLTSGEKARVFDELKATMADEKAYKQGKSNVGSYQPRR